MWTKPFATQLGNMQRKRGTYNAKKQHTTQMGHIQRKWGTYNVKKQHATQKGNMRAKCNQNGQHPTQMGQIQRKKVSTQTGRIERTLGGQLARYSGQGGGLAATHTLCLRCTGSQFALQILIKNCLPSLRGGVALDLISTLEF